jgi:type VI protein secretion system component VasA
MSPTALTKMRDALAGAFSVDEVNQRGRETSRHRCSRLFEAADEVSARATRPRRAGSRCRSSADEHDRLKPVDSARCALVAFIEASSPADAWSSRPVSIAHNCKKVTVPPVASDISQRGGKMAMRVTVFCDALLTATTARRSRSRDLRLAPVRVTTTGSSKPRWTASARAAGSR